MPVDIVIEDSEFNEDHGYLNLVNEEKDEDYAWWPFKTEDSDITMPEPNWTWENPESSKEEVSLSPSLKLEWDEPNTFHIFVKDGEVEHCGDCQCGCQ